MNVGRGVRLSLLIVGILTIHEGLLRGVRIDGVRPDLLLGVAVVAGLVGGSERGALVGFACGLATDLFLPTPLGLSALVLCVTAYAVGALKAAVLPSARGTAALTVLVASACGVVAFASLGALIGLPGTFSPHLVTVAATVAVVNAALSAPLLRIVRWSMATAPGRPSSLDSVGAAASSRLSGPASHTMGLRQR